MSLAVIPPLSGMFGHDGKISLPKRFINGMLMNLKLWDVPMVAILEPGGTIKGAFDLIDVDPATLPFDVKVMARDDPGLAEVLSRYRVVLATVAHNQNHMPELCRSVGSACVYVAEYSLKTRYEIIRVSTRNPLVMARRLLWQFNQEPRHRKAIRLAEGIQCNGTPCFEDYKGYSKSPLLFFDTRADEEMLATSEDLDRREAVLTEGKPLRLLFSGQFITMKGADHLPRIADEIRRLGVPFQFTLCGGGDLEPKIRSEIGRLGLGDRVKLAGVLDFKTELHPMTRSAVDLFVCPHVQGDPAGTYVDVMACGVPIVGYDNDALEGITRYSRSNRTVPMHRPDLIAKAVAELDADRGALMALARNALEFSRRNTFEHVNKVRIEHLKECLGQFKATPRAVS